MRLLHLLIQFVLAACALAVLIPPDAKRYLVLFEEIDGVPTEKLNELKEFLTAAGGVVSQEYREAVKGFAVYLPLDGYKRLLNREYAEYPLIVEEDSEVEVY